MAKIDPMYNLINTILEDREVVIFLGGGASMEGKQDKQRFPGSDDLIDRVLQKYRLKPKNKKERLDLFFEIIEQWEKEKRLSARLRKFLEDGEPGLAHYHLAALSIALFGESNTLLYLTKNFDDLINQAFKDLQRNQVRKFTPVVIPIHPELRGSEFQEIVINAEANLKNGCPVILKLFGDLNFPKPIIRQQEIKFQPKVEEILIEWMKKPMLVIGYRFSDKKIRDLLVASRGHSPVFIVNPSKKYPKIIKETERVIHLNMTFSDFSNQMLYTFQKIAPNFYEKTLQILHSCDLEKDIRYSNMKLSKKKEGVSATEIRNNIVHPLTFEEMKKVEKVVNELKTGKKSVWELNYELFEEVAFYCIVQYFSRAHLKDASYGKCVKGDIDTIIKIPDTNQSVYFVEWRYYREKNIIFESVARAFCAAIRFNPKMLIVISLMDISPQAKDYAQYYFGDYKRYGCDFLRLSLDDLLLLSDNNSQTSQKITNSDFLNDIEINSWKIIRRGTFSHEEIANPQNNTSVINVDYQLYYSIKFLIKGVRVENIRRINILSENGKRLNLFHLKDIYILNSGGITALFDIELKQISKARMIVPSFLQLFINNSCKSFSISLPKIYLPSREANLFGNFREEETGIFIEEIKKNSNNLIFIHGEGGIGKTYLCEKVCRELTAKLNYRAHLINISENSSEGIFYKLIWPVIAPGMEYVKRGLSEVDKQILKAIIEKELDDYDIDEISRLSDNIIDLNFKNVNLEALTYLCAKLLIRSSTPQIIVVSNCQKLSPGIINGFRHLFMSLDDLEWGQTKFILEYRDSIEDLNDEWERFVVEAKNFTKHSVLSKKINSLSKTQIIKGLNSAFIGNDSIFLSNSIIKKTGGNPLFIRQLVIHLQKSGYIKEIKRKSLTLFNVVDYVGVNKELEKLPGGLEAFLQKRIEFLVCDYFAKKPSRSELISYLSLASLYGFEYDDWKIAEIFAWKDKEIELVKLYLQSEGIIQSNLLDEKMRFVHEIMWLSVLTVLKNTKEFKQSILQTLSKLNRNSIEDTIVGGRALYYLDDLKSSFKWYNIAYELSFHSNSYTFQRTCLLGLKKILQREELLDETMARQKISVFYRLGQVEVQVGSQVDALKIFNQLLDEISIIKEEFLLNPNELSRDFISIKINKMTIHHRFLDPKSGVDVLKETIQHLCEIDDIEKITSRFLIICFNSNMIDTGHDIISIFRQLPDIKENYEELASHFSDIGNLYLHSNPALAHLIWKKGLELAVSEKQKTHSTLNCMIASLYDSKKFITESEVNHLAERIKVQGVENQMIRLLIYKGIYQFSKKKYNDSRYFFQTAIKRARLKNLKFLEWQAHNNIAICDLILEKVESATKHFEKSLVIVKNTIDFFFGSRKEVAIIGKKLLERHKLFSRQYYISTHPIFENLAKHPKPNASGTFNIFLFNLYQLKSYKSYMSFIEKATEILELNGKKNDFFSKSYFDNFYLLKSQEHPLKISWKKRSFFLAIE